MLQATCKCLTRKGRGQFLGWGKRGLMFFSPRSSICDLFFFRSSASQARRSSVQVGKAEQSPCMESAPGVWRVFWVLSAPKKVHLPIDIASSHHQLMPAERAAFPDCAALHGRVPDKQRCEVAVGCIPQHHPGVSSRRGDVRTARSDRKASHWHSLEKLVHEGAVLEVPDLDLPRGGGHRQYWGVGRNRDRGCAALDALTGAPIL
mmetsp:Transcript_4352/g.10540  ORF Transcript_4352/g.10540 Transcript_4352/m.10540 type:complete len:205 (-) Transcript_4352:837-1451(-)